MNTHTGQRCLFCGGDPNERGHWRFCDGKQGAVEAEEWAVAPVEPLHNVRTTDPETSYAAAFAHQSHRGSQRKRCLFAIDATEVRGLIDVELADVVGIQLNSANKRRGELRDKGLVVDSGRRRLTPAGSLAIVWVAARWATSEGRDDH